MTGGAGGGVDWPTAGSPVTPDAAAGAARGDGTPSVARTPVRTCVGCRGKGSRTDLMRVVAIEGVAVLDLRARAAGRGAWLHPDPACLALAERRRALPRAPRVPAPLDLAELRTGLERLAAERGAAG